MPLSDKSRGAIADVSRRAGMSDPTPVERDIAAPADVLAYGHHRAPIDNASLTRREAAEEGRAKDARLRAAELRRHGVRP